MKFFNLFSIRPILREARGIRLALERANVLREAEFNALRIDFPALHPPKGKDAEMQVFYTDQGDIDAEIERRKYAGTEEEE